MARKPAEDHPPLPVARLRVPGDPAGDGRPLRLRRLPQMLDQFAEDSAVGDTSVIENALRG